MQRMEIMEWRRQEHVAFMACGGDNFGVLGGDAIDDGDGVDVGVMVLPVITDWPTMELATLNDSVTTDVTVEDVAVDGFGAHIAI
jgi:hypothetical protein